MKKILLIKTLVLFTIILLIGLGLSPVSTSNKIVEQTQKNNIVVNTSKLKIDNAKTYSLYKIELNLLKNYLSDILPSEIASDTTINEIINLIKNTLNSNPSLLRKTLVISQGWSYDTNFFKNTRLQIKRDAFSFWHYTQASKTGIESKTFIIRANDLISSKTIELYRGTQTGFMFRPIGIYLFQKKTVPQLSYTLFIGFASYVYVSAQEEIQIPFPFTLP